MTGERLYLVDSDVFITAKKRMADGVVVVLRVAPRAGAYRP